MTATFRVIQYGLGPVGQMVTRDLLARGAFEIVGAVDVDTAKVGRDVATLAGLDEPIGVVVSPDAGAVLSVEADAVVLTTTSSVVDAERQIAPCVAAGKHVVSTCEELAYPWRTQPDLAHRLNTAAKANHVTVLGTGVNPGFLMDLLPVVVSGVCRRVDAIRIERIQGAQHRRVPFQRKIGAGLTLERFESRRRDGSLRHVGLTESMHMIAARLGWQLDRTEDRVEPVVADRRIETPGMTVEAGEALGVCQTGRGWRDGREVLTLVFTAAVGQPEPRDRVRIDGEPPMDVIVEGGTHGDVATTSITVNAIPVVCRAPAGLRTMADIEPVSCFCGAEAR